MVNYVIRHRKGFGHQAVELHMVVDWTKAALLFILVFVIIQRLIVPRGFLADTVRREPMPLEAFSMVLTSVSPVRRIVDLISAKPLCLGVVHSLHSSRPGPGKNTLRVACHHMEYID